jgi:hypothetical protein
MNTSRANAKPAGNPTHCRNSLPKRKAEPARRFSDVKKPLENGIAAAGIFGAPATQTTQYAELAQERTGFEPHLHKSKQMNNAAESIALFRGLGGMTFERFQTAAYKWAFLWCDRAGCGSVSSALQGDTMNRLQ